MKMLTTTLLAALCAMTLFVDTVLADADVQIIHNSPDPAAASVDIYVDGDLAVPGLGFREATPVVSLPSDMEIVIGIAPAGGSVIANFPVTLMGGSRYAVMATGVLDEGLTSNPDGIDVGFGLEIWDMLMSTAPMGQVGILAFHGSPDAPTVNIDAVGVGTLVPGLAFREFAGTLFVPADDYTLQIAPASDPGSYVAAFTAPLSGLDGGAAVVFASGFLTDTQNAFGLFAALADGTVLTLGSTPVPAETMSMSSVKSMFSN